MLFRSTSDREMTKKNLFDKFAALMFRDKLYGILGVALLFAGMYISTKLLLADYSMSRFGYEMLPSQKIEGTIGAVALMPQFFQWLSLFIIISLQTDNDPDNDKYTAWIALVGLISMLFDIGTDLYYQTGGFQMALENIGVTIVESVVVFTLASDFLFAFCLSVILAIVLRFFGRSIQHPGQSSNQRKQDKRRAQSNRPQQQSQQAPRRDNGNAPQRQNTPQPVVRNMPEELELNRIREEMRGRS
jgi:hypothetical protein